VALVLRVRGWSVETASNGHEALARLRDGLRPSLVLLDMMMPGMDGAQFLAAVRGDVELAGLCVVLVSGDPFALERVGKLTVDGFMRKPVNLADLLALVTRVCGAVPRAEAPP